MKPYGRIKNIKGFKAKRSLFKDNNWWEEMSEPVSSKTARHKAKILTIKEVEENRSNAYKYLDL